MDHIKIIKKNEKLELGFLWGKKKGVEKIKSREIAWEDDRKKGETVEEDVKKKEVFKTKTKKRSTPPLGDGKYSYKFQHKAEQDDGRLLLSMEANSRQGGDGRLKDYSQLGTDDS